MSNIEHTPYYEFVSNQILKASDLNTMQKRIAEAIQEAQSSGTPNALGGALTTIEYDFATQGTPAVTFDLLVMGMPYMSFYKISDIVPTREQLNGALFYSNYLGDRNAYDPFVLSKDTIMFENEILIGYGSYSVNEGNYEGNYAIGVAYDAGTSTVIIEGMEMEITVPEAGVYLPFDGDIEGIPWYSSLTYFNGTQVDWNENNEFAVNYIKNRPCYSKELEFKEEKILEQTTISNFTPVTVAGQQIYMAEVPPLLKPIFMTKNYKVVVNNEEKILSATIALHYETEPNYFYPAFYEAGIEAMWIIGDQSLSQVPYPTFNEGLGFAIACDMSGIYLFTASNTPLTLEIFTSNIVIPKNLYTFQDPSATDLPAPALIPAAIDTPIASLDPADDCDYLISFDGKQYKASLETDGPLMMGMAKFQGIGNPTSIFTGKSDLPFLVIDFMSMLQEVFLKETLYDEGGLMNLEAAKMFSVIMSFEVGLSQGVFNTPTMFLSLESGEHEIEVIKIPKEIKTISNSYLPDNNRGLELSLNSNKKCISNLPFGKDFGYSSYLPSLNGTAQYIKNVNGFYIYQVSLNGALDISQLKERYLLMFENGLSYEMSIPSFDYPYMGNMNVFMQFLGIQTDNRTIQENPFALLFQGSSLLMLISAIDLGGNLNLTAAEMYPVAATIPKDLLPTNAEQAPLILPEFNSGDEGKILKIVNGVPTWVDS